MADAQTGVARWRYATPDNVTSAAAVAENRVYFGSWDGTVYALDLTGELRWRYPTAGWVSAAPLLHDGILYVGSQDGSFYALDAENGEPIWDYRTLGRIESSAALAGELIIVASSDGYLHALDRQSGERQWFFFTGGGVVAPPWLTVSNSMWLRWSAPYTRSIAGAENCAGPSERMPPLAQHRS